ncbi:hypothetical protein G6F43_003376 [Rhizopus delemar]|nr:hypothetical protein G6F43_003376 [Rhizopus delemar]
MLALSRSFATLSVIPATRLVAARAYATVGDKQSRHPALHKDNAPDLNKLDTILDYSSEKPDTLDQKKTFTPHRPTDVVLNTVTDIIDTPLSSIEQRDLMKKALVVKRVVNMNGKGKQPSMYALVVVGNGNGLAGYGEGKDEEATRAIRKATNRAIKNLRYFERYDNRTLSMDLTHKFHATTLELRARPPGFGIRTNHYVHEICKCIGIQDISAKVRGSTTPMNVIKAAFEALSNTKQPEDIAKMRGKKLADVQHVYFGGN